MPPSLSAMTGRYTSAPDHVATITYNRPDALNAINGEMRRGPQRRVRPLPRRRGRVGRDRHRRRAARSASAPTCATARARPASSPGTFWEKPTDQLVRERVGDLQAGDRGGERLLPRLRAHARDVVRLRDRERARRVRLPRGRHRRADDRRRDPAPAAHQLAVRDGAAAHRRAHRRRARQGDRARGLGRPARRR